MPNDLAPVERETAVDADGWEYDVATGEVLGRPDVHELFEVRSVDDAEWVLELRSAIEGEIAGVRARLKAIESNLRALESAQVRRLSWWEWRFAPSLVAFARRQLTGKSRTVRFAWGKVAFRKTRGSTDILDPERALEFVRAWNPKAIRVKEHVTTADVLATLHTIEMATHEVPETPNWLIRSGEAESVTISTGIDVQVREET